MKQFYCNKKTGFKNLTPTRPVIIRDFRGRMFYSTVGLKPVEKFNLPKGLYFLESGSIKKLPYNIKYKLAKLPRPERHYPFPYHFKIYFSFNPNKCTIQWGKKRIIFDTELKNSVLPELFFMLYHEHGHALYATEKYADRFARNMMVKRGYNPSQIGKAPLYSLSERQYHRKKYLINSLTK